MCLLAEPRFEMEKKEMDEWEIQGGQYCWTASAPIQTRRLTFGFDVYKGNILCVSGSYERAMFTKFDPKLN